MIDFILSKKGEKTTQWVTEESAPHSLNRLQQEELLWFTVTGIRPVSSFKKLDLAWI